MRRKKESGGGAHRGARALVGWREETGAVAFQRRREVERRPAKLRATLRLCEREEEARPSPTGEKWGGERTTAALTSEWGRRRRHDRICGEGRRSNGGGDRKSNEEGSCPWGASE
jgi:hypothetical protein